MSARGRERTGRARGQARVLAIAALCLGAAVEARAAPAPARDDAADTVDVESLVAEALRRQPHLARARQQAAAAKQLPYQAARPADPWLSVQGQNIVFNDPRLQASPMSAVALGLTQQLPFPGKLRRRRDVARARSKAVDDAVHVSEVATALRVRRSYWELHFAEEAVAISEESVKVLDTLTNVVMTRLSVGMVGQQDALQAEVAHSKLRAELRERRQAVVSGRRAVNAAVGRAPTDRLGRTRAPGPREHLDRASARAALKEANPELERQRSLVLAAEQSNREARYDRWPDLSFGATYRIRRPAAGDRTNGADMFVLGFGISLPVWARRKQNARVQETAADVAAAQAGVQATQLDLLTLLEQTLDAVERLDAEIELYDHEVLPQARSAVDASLSDYEVGKVGFVSVLQNWEVELDARLMRERLLAERAVRSAEVQALVGEAAG